MLPSSSFLCQTAVRNTLGYIRSSSVSEIVTSLKQSAISRPVTLNKPNFLQSGQEANLNSCNTLRNIAGIGPGAPGEFPQSKILENGGPPLGSGYNSVGPLSYEKWSSGAEGMPMSGTLSYNPCLHLVFVSYCVASNMA